MKVYENLPDDLRDWALQQTVFFTASAPLSGKHINCSPKGLADATFCVFDSTHCAYVDATGSSAETISHVYENGRVTIMFCSFGPLCRIMRVYCHGSVIENDSPLFEPTLKRMGKEPHPGHRAIIMLEVWKVVTSCGMQVPRLSEGSVSDSQPAELQNRYDLNRWAEGMHRKEKLRPYWAQNNSFNFDGMPSMKRPRREVGNNLLVDQWSAIAKRGLQEKAGMAVGFVAAMVLVWLVRIFTKLAERVSTGGAASTSFGSIGV